MAIRDFRGKIVLVTGTASGIGRETALAFARAGADLVVCDLNASGLEETAQAIRGLGRRVLARQVDVASRAAMEEFAAAVHREHAAVDVLVNNAGVGLVGGLLDTTLDDWDWIIGINLRGVVHGCHFFLPAMIARGGGGHVVNVASMAGYSATAPLVAYGATKFAVVGLSEGLRDELHAHRIGVTAICPGIINTAITATSPMRGRQATAAARTMVVALYQRRNYGPERVAGQIVRAVQRNRSVVPVSPEAWVVYFLKRLAPALNARLQRALTARVQRAADRAAGKAKGSG